METKRKRETAVCGFQAVRSLGDRRPEVVKRLFFTAKRAPAFGPLCAWLAREKRLYRTAEAAELERLSGSVHHQGVVAMIDDPGPQTLTAAIVADWAKGGARVLLLDRIGDDHNLGSIARTAAFLGYDALVLSTEPGAAGLSTSAYRVARGGLEFIKLYQVANASECIELCKGQLTSVGADHRGAVDVRQFAWRYAEDSSAALLLVLGNEEKGLSMSARAACDVLVRIRGTGQVESLNVSQTAAIFLYELAPASALQAIAQPLAQDPAPKAAPRAPHTARRASPPTRGHKTRRPRDGGY